MQARYRVIAGRGFEKDARQIRKRVPHMLQALREAAALLRDDPYNLRGHTNMTKLTDVRAGEGQFRLRFGDWRLRYDVVGDDDILCSMGPRRDSYRP